MSLVVHSLRSNVPLVLRTSRATRLSVATLSGVLLYLLVGQAIRPGFTDYWSYQLFQVSVTLVAVLLFDVAFEREGGMTWQTHLLIISAALADTLGNAGNMYVKVVHYDKVVHFASGAAVAALAYQALGHLEACEIVKFSRMRRAAIAVLSSFLLAGFLWESYEFLSDFVFATERVYGWMDTLGDFVADIAGAIVAVCVVMWAESRRRSATCTVHCRS